MIPQPVAALRAPWLAPLLLTLLTGTVTGGLGTLTGCAAVDGDGVRRQQPLGADVSDRDFVSLRWRRGLRRHGIFTYQPEEYAGAAASHGGRRVYLGTGDGRFRAFDAFTGKTFWEIDLGVGITSTPLVVEHLGLLFVGAGDGALHAISLATGKRVWRYGTKGISYQPAVYSDGVVFFANDRDQVFSLDARSGRWRWSYDRETPQSFTVSGHGGPVVVGDRLLAGFSDGTLVCLGTRGGETQWTRSLTGNAKEYVDVDATPVVSRGVVYAASFSGGLFAVTLDGGALRWRFPVVGASTAALAGDRVYFASARKGLHSLDLEGRLRWRQHLDAGTPRAPQVRGRALYLALSEGGLYVVDRLTGRLIQRYNPGGGISGRPLLTRDSLFVLSNRGLLYAFTLR